MKLDDHCKHVTLIIREYAPTTEESAKQYYREIKENSTIMRDQSKNDPEYDNKHNEIRTKNQRLAQQRVTEAMIALSS